MCLRGRRRIEEEWEGTEVSGRGLLWSASVREVAGFCHIRHMSV